MATMRIGLVLLLLSGLLAITGCERTESTQLSYRGLGLTQLYKPSKAAALAELNVAPKPLKKANPDGPRAEDYYENVQVLGDYSKSEFARTMSSIKNWVASDTGCGYCHIAPTYNLDDKYQKRVAREMIRMTRRINTQWSAHVGKTGVTCYTCHRGQPVPAKLWYLPPPREQRGYTKLKASMPLPLANNTGLPVDALANYLLGDDSIRIVGTTPLAGENRHSINQAKLTYSMMMVISESLGVNCDYCHNTRSFYSWDQSRPQRATAWWGIRMVRDLNNNVMVPLTGTFPPERLGPMGDAPKIYCATCHQGVFKPLYGAIMIGDFPELVGPKTPGYVGGPRPVQPEGDAAGKPAPDAPASGDYPAGTAPAAKPVQKTTSVTAPAGPAASAVAPAQKTSAAKPVVLSKLADR